jgi:TonB-dependent starch-binding outer membrane protein SusC
MMGASVQKCISSGIMATFLFLGGTAPAEAQVEGTVMALRGEIHVQPGDGSLLSRPAGLSVKGATVPEALALLSTTASVSVAFSPNYLPGGVRVDCECRDVSIAEALDRILSATEFGYLELGDQVVIAKRAPVETMESLKKLPTGWAEASRSLPSDLILTVTQNGLPITARVEKLQETGVITGRVTGAGTGQPLSGVQIAVAGTLLGTLTNEQGRYVISGVPAGSHTVSALLLGFRDQTGSVTIQAGSTVVMDFALQQAAIVLDALVVTGTPGATRRRALPNTVTQVQASEVTAVSPVSTVTQLLQARTPGLTIMPASGQVGAASSFRIRGAGSLSAGNHPVVYVDGVRIRSADMGGFGTNNVTQRTSMLDMMNPDDIESIEVIKGPAATTLYGADAAAGVIQIITKKGQFGQQGIRWEGQTEFGTIDWHLGMRNNYTLCTTQGELAHTSTAISRITHNSWPGCHGMDPNAPWRERLLVESPLGDPGVLRSGRHTGYDLAARGGGDRYAFYVSGGRQEEDGVFQNNWFNRTTGRGNFNFTPIDPLEIIFTTQYSKTGTRIPLNDNASQGWLRNAWRGRPGFNDPWAKGWLGLGPEQIAIYNNVDRIERFVLGATAKYHPTTWFRTQLSLGMDAGDRVVTLFYPIDRTGGQPYGATNAQGYISNMDRTTRDYTVNYVATLVLNLLPELSSSFSFGAQYISENYRSLQTVGEGLIADAVKLIHVDNNLATRVFENTTEQRSLGFFLEEQLGWRDRAFLTFGLRIDDHSAFGENFSVVTYPKIGASWVISEEPFLQLRGFDNLRLRAAYGHAGNAPSPFAADRVYGAATGVGDDGALMAALDPEAYGNPDLRAERGVEIELGADASFLEDRLGIEFTYYNNTTRDALVSVPVAPSSGFAGSTLRNVGELRNSGLELAVIGSPMRTRDFNWDTRFSIATNENLLVSMGEAREFIPVGYRDSQRHQEGYPLGGYWAAIPLRDGSGNLLLDQQGRPVLAEEMEYVGTPMPTLEAALTNSFTLFRSLRIHTFLDYKGGHHLFNMTEATSINDGNHRLANDPELDAESWLLLRWAGNGPFIERADFLKLREVSLRYDVPDRFSQRIGGSNISLSVAALNLAVLWTRYKTGVDPEVSVWGPATFGRAESNSVPMMRRLVGTVRFSF